MRYRAINSLLAVGVGFFCCYHSIAYSGGVQLFEQSVTYLGTAFAGTAASAEDASTAFYNPAGLTQLEYPELQAALTSLDVHVNTTVTSSTSNSVIGSLFGLPPAPVQGYDKDEAGSWNFIPALNLAFPSHHRVAFGLSVSAPFGLNTDFDSKSKVKYLATSSKVSVIDVGPSIALQLTPEFSLGAGVDIQYAKLVVHEKAPVGENLPLIPLGGPYPDGNFENTARDVGYGWNAGILYEFNCAATRLGLSYRSRVHHKLEGNAYLDLPAPLHSLPGYLDIGLTTPDSVNLSAYHDINCQWAVLSTVNYTHWSLVEAVNLHYTGLITQAIEEASVPLNFKDSYRYSLGANFSPTNRFKLRGGLAYDQTPIKSSDKRTFRVPDSDRYWLSVGAQYKMSPCLVLDAGYSHLFIQSSHNDQTQTLALTNGTTLVANARGEFAPEVNEFGLQLTWLFI